MTSSSPAPRPTERPSDRRALLLIPSVIDRGIEGDIAAGRHPRMDYFELERALSDRGCAATTIDDSALRGGPAALRDLRLALYAFRRRNEFDAIFCNSESIALPLGALLSRAGRRPRVVAIGHRISTPKKRAFFAKWHSMDAIDTLFLYASEQKRFACEDLGLPEDKVPLIPFHADTRFFTPERPPLLEPGRAALISSAGLEWRDYPTLLEVARRMPGCAFHLAAASPWSKRRNETERADIPSNVTIDRLSYADLRALYRRSALVVVPLYETDFQAGVTTLLEAMACGRPVVATRTKGQTDVIEHESNGLYVKPGDADDLTAAIERVLTGGELGETLGRAGRAWVEANATIDLWSERVAAAVAGEN